MSNFAMLNQQWPLLAKIGMQAEANVYRDPNTTLIKVRLFAEQVTEAIFSLEQMVSDTIGSQVDKLKTLEFEGVIEGKISQMFHSIRRLGNKAVHDHYDNPSDAMNMLRYAYILGAWFMEVYGPLDFQAEGFKTPKDTDTLTNEEIKKLQKQLEEVTAEKKLFKIELEKALQASAMESKETIASIRETRRRKSQAFLKRANLNEKETRLTFIDEQLRNAGWEVDTENLKWAKGARPEKNKNKAISEFPIHACDGKEYADYALFIGTRLVGVVEAKRYNEGAVGHLFQAKIYAENIIDGPKVDEYQLEKMDSKYKVPFLYASNGRPYIKQLEEESGIHFWDARTPTKAAKPLEVWHSPDDLLQKLAVDEKKAEEELKKEPFNDFELRYYQINAVKAVEKGLEDGKSRMLVAMATGTGKTRLALALMYRLIKTRRVRRILFLVDRKSLGLQAQDALQDAKINNESFNDIYEIKGIEDILPEMSTKIHIATVQGMVRRLFYKDEPREIPSVGAYDFIIVDEAHRGYTEDREMSDDELLFQNNQDYVSQYRRVIDYFDATVVGLTATPALHTTEIFGPPIYTYSYTDAVIDGCLVDHEPPIKFETELSKAGIHFDKDEVVDIWDDDTKTVDKAYLEDELNFKVEDFNRKVITENFNRAIVSGLIQYIDPNDPGKTLIFAANDQHADLIVRLLKEAYAADGTEVDDDAIQKITGYLRYPEKAIKKFKNEKMPSIVVTVDLLTTGIDVPEITNLVFMRQVRSRILYDQMLGRATRLCPDIGKDSFRIFDAAHLYDHLQNITDMKPVVANPNLSITDIVDKALQAEEEDGFEFFKSELMAKLQRKKQRVSKEDAADMAIAFGEESIDSWISKIKDMDKETLAKEVDKIKRFSSWRVSGHIQVISGQEDKLIDISRGYGEDNDRPADYLNKFNQFIRDNQELIPAIKMVVSRPKELTYDDLRIIRTSLKERGFDEKHLQNAWKQEKKEHIVADIISFIRQAALGIPLEDHESRIKRAMQKVYGMADWTLKQIKWLERIEKQLMKDPVLAPTAEEYFNSNLLWRREGGYRRIDEQLNNQLDLIVNVLNEQLYMIPS